MTRVVALLVALLSTVAGTPALWACARATGEQAKRCCCPANDEDPGRARLEGTCCCRVEPGDRSTPTAQPMHEPSRDPFALHAVPAGARPLLFPPLPEGSRSANRAHPPPASTLLRLGTSLRC